MTENEPVTPGGTSTGTKTVESTDVSTLLGSPHMVILFNDDVHSFEEVIAQLIKAIKCTKTAAEQFAMKAHTNGKTPVFSGNLERCEFVESLLAAPPVNLRTEIQ